MADKTVSYNDLGTDFEQRFPIIRSRPLLTLWPSSLTPDEYALLDAFLSKIEKNADQRQARLTNADFKEMPSIASDMPVKLANLRNASVVLMTASDGSDDVVTLFERTSYEENENGNWTATLECTLAAREHVFLADSINQCRYEVRSMAALDSRSSYLLFLYVEQHRAFGSWDVPLQELRDALGYDKEYAEFKFFNSKILNRAHADITKKTECQFTYLPVRKGRSVATIHFEVQPRETSDATGSAAQDTLATCETDCRAMIESNWERLAAPSRELVPNVMLLGASGAGKSSLVNVVFGDSVVDTPSVSEGTSEFTLYPGAQHGASLNLIDSPGYKLSDSEGGTFGSYFEAIQRRISEIHTAQAATKRTHMIWYCLSVAGGRVREADIKILRTLRAEPELRSRVGTVLTKCDQDDENGAQASIFRQVLSAEVGADMPVFEVSNDPKVQLQLDQLIAWSATQFEMAEALEGQCATSELFVSSQTASIAAKQAAATKRIAAYATAAAGIAAVPIPVANTALLLPLQVTMATHVIRIYGLQNYAHISEETLKQAAIANLSTAFAGGLVNLVPFAGALISGAVNAGVASLVTYAFGSSVSQICARAAEQLASGHEMDISRLFDAESIHTQIRAYMQ